MLLCNGLCESSGVEGALPSKADGSYRPKGESGRDSDLGKLSAQETEIGRHCCSEPLTVCGRFSCNGMECLVMAIWS